MREEPSANVSSTNSWKMDNQREDTAAQNLSVGLPKEEAAPDTVRRSVEGRRKAGGPRVGSWTIRLLALSRRSAACLLLPSSLHRKHYREEPKDICKETEKMPGKNFTAMIYVIPPQNKTTPHSSMCSPRAEAGTPPAHPKIRYSNFYRIQHYLLSTILFVGKP